MQLLLRITAITYLLFILTIQFVDTGYSPNQVQKATEQTEKTEENKIIAQDSYLTRQINLNRFISDFSSYLKTDPNNATQKILTHYPNIQLVKVNKEKTFSPHIMQNQTLIVVNDSPTSIQENGKSFSHLKISIRNKSNITHYLFRIPEDLSTNIQIKQQSRMYTVTHLQNNKWKTIPTKYRPSKKLSLGIEQKLPDLKPNEETKGLSHYIQNEVVIKFKPLTTQQEVINFLKKYDLSLKEKKDQTILAFCPERNTKTLIRTIEKDKRIEYVEPHFIYLTNETKQPINNKFVVPNDKLYSEYQWNLPMIHTEQGWAFAKGKEDVVIAIVDTGVDLNHPEFRGKLVKGKNIVEPNKSPMDDDGHGTHVAGIIAANTNNNEGIAGITWYNKIMPIKVLDQSGAGTLFDVAQGIIWATDHGADVINLSLGNYAESKYLHDAVKYAHSKNVVLVAATGNDNTGQQGYPASYPEVIGVSAIDPYQKRAEFSNYGDDVDVVAPGVNIASTYPNNQYAALSGTSMASPHVAALAGLIKSKHPELTSKQIKTIITESAIDLGEKGKDQYFGYGEIHILNAINKSNELVKPKENAIPNHPKKTIPKQKKFFQHWLETLFG